MARVIAIGAGIAGMAAAIGLRRLNLETLMRLESSEECFSWKVISPAERGIGSSNLRSTTAFS